MRAPEFSIDGKVVGAAHATYFIADISANHDGDIGRAKALIELAAASGADAAKFQHFRAESIVSKEGFDRLGGKRAHQARWRKEVHEVYQDASVPRSWTPILKETCDRVGIAFFSTPYDLESVDHLDEYVSVYKIGSGDIDWPELHNHIARKGKPILLAAGAAELRDVTIAMQHLSDRCEHIGLMQCNTNYTGKACNLQYVNLRVLETFAFLFPDAVLGLSDHTDGCSAALGAVALGARIVEKHFTDDRRREGPDHAFSMMPSDWKEMVQRTRELESALGVRLKRVEENERESFVVQRRCVRAARDLPAGTVIGRNDLIVLRPAPDGCIRPGDIDAVVGSIAVRDIPKGRDLKWSDLELSRKSDIGQ